MNIKKLKTALEIFEKYSPNPETMWVYAEHDELYVDALDVMLSEEDFKIVGECGFFQKEAEADENDMAIQAPEYGWMAYV